MPVYFLYLGIAYMLIANQITKEELDFLYLTTKVVSHPKYGLHLKAKTFEEIISDPTSINYNLEEIKRSCYSTKGGFVGSLDINTGYLTYSTRYFSERKRFLVHRLIFMLHYNILLEEHQLINHIDGIRCNNSIENLEVVSIAENSHIYRALGTQRLFEDYIPKPDRDGKYSIYICSGNNSKLCIGTSRDVTLVTKLYTMIKEIRINIENADIELSNFINTTKYKTLDDRFSLLKINILQSDYRILYDAIVNFNKNLQSQEIRQSGVLLTRYGYYEVKIKVNGKSVGFGSYGKDLNTANSVVLKVRELKNNNFEHLLSIINSKPNGILAKDYYLEHLFRN